MRARGLGIELDADGVRALALEGGKRPRILAFSERHIDPDDQRPWIDRAKEAVAAAVAEAGGVRGRIAASIDSGDAMLRELQLPFTNDEQIRKTVRFELEQHIHNHAIEDLAVDYLKTGSTEKGTQILVAAVPKALLEERLRLFESAGADPAVVDLDALALFNALVEAGAVTDDEPLLALYGGSRFTKFLLIENRRPRAIRTIRFSPTPPSAGADLPAEVATEFSDSETKELYVLVDNATPVDILAIEAGRFLMASAASAVPKRILITGRLDVESLAGPLTEATGAPVEEFDVLSKFEPVPPSVQGLGRRIPVALGLALKAVDHDATGTDFRRDEYSYAKKFDTVKSSALVLVDLVLMLLALVALHLHFKSVDLEGETDTLLAYQSQVVADSVEHNPAKIPAELKDDPAKSLDYMKKMIARMNEKLGAGDHPIEQSSLHYLSRIWKTLDQFHKESSTRKLGDKPFYLLVDSASANQDPARATVQIAIGGLAANIDVADAFLQRLRSAPTFSSLWSITPGPYKTVGDHTRFDFTLRKGKE